MDNLEDLKRFLTNVGEIIGESVFLPDHILSTLFNLDYQISKSKVRSDLEQYKVDFLKIHIAPQKYKLNPMLVLYPQSTFWEYLQELDKKGHIDLKENRIKRIEDILDRKLHIPDPIILEDYLLKPIGNYKRKS